MNKFPVTINLQRKHLELIEAKKFWFRPRFIRPFEAKTLVIKNDILFEPYSRCSEDALTWGSNLKLGAFTYISLGCYLPDTEIGRYCSIGSNVRLMPGGHPIDRVTTSTVTYSKKISELFREDFGVEMQCKAPAPSPKTIIGNDVWIGDDVVLKPGITIGDGAVIGFRSVVTKDVAPYAVVAGVPAAKKKNRFSDQVCDKLKKTQWWTLHPKLLAKLDLIDVEKFLVLAAAPKSVLHDPKNIWPPQFESLVKLLVGS